MNNNVNKTPEQFALIEELYEKIKALNNASISSSDLTYMIDKMVAERKKHLQREKDEAKHQAELIAQKKEQEEKEQHIKQVTSMELPLDFENAFAADERTKDLHVDSISDGLILSLSNLGRVDIEYISTITGQDCKSVICALKGSIYQNPDTWEECFYKGWETSEEYLSGNLNRKWQKAKEANDFYHGYFSENLRAIEKVLPSVVAAKDIYITLGSPFVPTDIIDDFITHILSLTKHPYTGTLHDPLTGTWEIPHKGCDYYRSRVAATTTYGTPRMEALYILERTLNMKPIVVNDEVLSQTSKSGKKKVINHTETVLALEKQKKMIAAFQNWVWKDEKRKERLETIFDNNFACVRRRVFDGSFLRFPTMSPAVQLYPYQKNAVARILFSKNTLLAHEVGSGKTYVMIAAGMELKRMGLSQKNLYVVPNNIVGQWQDIFCTMYPQAKLLCVQPKDFTPKKKEHTLIKIRDGEYDAIIMAHSCFERIPLSARYYEDELKARKEQILKIAGGNRKSTKSLAHKKEAIKKALAKLLSEIDDTDPSLCFDKLGITRLFVDEAHNYKNLPIETKADHTSGISASGSKKCSDMLDKVHMIQQQNDGGGVVMATGTPITNSITDIYVMHKYLQSGELAMLDLQSFDGWIGMFAEKETDFEIDVDTSNYRMVTRFARFHNLPELTSLLSSIADFHRASDNRDVPDFDGYHDALIDPTDEFSLYLENISARAERVRKGGVSSKDDNMLKITTDGRKAALDLRLVNPTSAFTYQSKVARCAENIFDIYHKTAEKKSTQVVFCDSSTPKKGFNLYDEMKRLLVTMGIPAEQIAFVHDAESERARTRLFGRIKSGDVRVVIGSTQKLGTGVNVQDKLIALHHLDVPWRPADMTQREGRILRNGNENDKVMLYRYITKGSFDAYSWQLLETKERFIEGLLSGSLAQRSGSDVENTVLNYAEVKALAIGNPLIKKRVETANELSRYLFLHRTAIETHIRLEKEQMELPAKILHQTMLIEKCKQDLAFCSQNNDMPEKEERKHLRGVLYQALQNHVLMSQEKVALQYRGFDVVLPVNMSLKKPYVWLQREGRYYVELGDTEVGMLIRMDHYLDKLDEHLLQMQTGLANLQQRQAAIQTEIAYKEDYADKIEELQQKLKELDKKLGVKVK